jgi:AcrR family transcriptional regulator
VPADQNTRGPSRLSSGVRRQAIIEAVKQVFAEKGFDGTTTRELAKAAGISEALLYNYFPSKESLYDAMLGACAEAPVCIKWNRIRALEPSAATLVIMVHSLMAELVQSSSSHVDNGVLGRLGVRSLLEDGEFVRASLKAFASTWVVAFEECLKAAAKFGDLREFPMSHDLRAWFVHHIAFALMLHLYPKAPAIDYKVPKETLIEQAVYFALRGVGLKDEAIKRHYDPKSLRLLAE